MPIDRAVQLDNWVCRPGWIEPRRGFVIQSSGLGTSKTPVQSLMAYNGIDGTRKLFGVAGGTIYDCSNAGTAAIPTTVTGLQSSRLQYVMFADPGMSQFLVTVNGADNPWTFNGASWSQPDIFIGNASGSITWSVNMVPNETINLNGTIIKFVSSSPTGNEVVIGATLADTLASLLSFLQASGDSNITQFTYFTTFGTTLNIIAAVPGNGGNSLTIAAGYATGSIDFSVNPSNGDTITLDGTVVEFVTNNTAYATGSIVFAINPSNGNTITLAGTTVTFVTSGATGFQVNIGVNLATTLNSLVALLQASTNAALTQFTYGQSVGTTLVLTAATVGIGGNFLSIAASNATPSGDFLTGGSSGAAGNQVNISTTLQLTLASLLSFLQGSGDAGIQEFTYVVSGNNLLLTAANAGTLGNLLLISASAATASGPTLTGGSSAAASGRTLTGGGQDYGITPDTFIQVNSYMNRLWFVPNNSTNVVYLQTIDGVSGAASVFPLGQLIKKGGYIMAIGTWTVDTRQNVDEYIAFITSRGEVIVYQGTDPTTATTFALTGIYQVGAPIGRRCFLRITGDLQIITVDGAIGMSEMLSTDRAAANRVSLTSIIMNQMNISAQAYKNNFGWQMIEYPLGTLVILNIPVQENAQQIQYVMNTITGAWSRFVGTNPTTGLVDYTYGINANCWEVDAFDNIYFGDNHGNVCQWYVGSGDNSLPITCIVQTAYNSFGNGAQLKRYPMLQPLITTTGNPIPSVGINVDFNQTNILSTAQPLSSGVPLWNQVNWNQFNWPGGPATTDAWTSVQGIGHYVSIVTQVSTTSTASNPTFVTTLQLNGWNIIAESGAFV